jgi:hypothetical protein
VTNVKNRFYAVFLKDKCQLRPFSLYSIGSTPFDGTAVAANAINPGAALLNPLSLPARIAFYPNEVN